jgi:ABC-type multidrug transport system ATPase subunit
MPESDIEEEVTSILTDIDLLDKADAIAEKLSGGQKRKLSVGKKYFSKCLKGQCHEMVIEVRPWSGNLALN